MIETYVTVPLATVVLGSGASITTSTVGSALAATALGAAAAGAETEVGGAMGLGAAVGLELREPSLRRSAYVKGTEGADGSFCVGGVACQTLQYPGVYVVESYSVKLGKAAFTGISACHSRFQVTE